MEGVASMAQSRKEPKGKKSKSKGPRQKRGNETQATVDEFEREGMGIAPKE